MSDTPEPCRLTPASEWIRQLTCETHDVTWPRSDGLVCPFEGLEPA